MTTEEVLSRIDAEQYVGFCRENPDLAHLSYTDVVRVKALMAGALRAERAACARRVCARCLDGEPLARDYSFVLHGEWGCAADQIWDRDRTAAIASGQTEAEWLAGVSALLAEGAK